MAESSSSASHRFESHDNDDGSAAQVHAADDEQKPSTSNAASLPKEAGSVVHDEQEGEKEVGGLVDQQEPLVSTAKPKHIYKDYSHIKPNDDDDDDADESSGGSRDTTFIMKMFTILSNPKLEHIVSWLPHGRAWRVHQKEEFEQKVIPLYFRHSRYSSFMRQVNGWGFQRINRGPDYNSYYHELFLRGMPHLARKMRRLTGQEKKSKSAARKAAKAGKDEHEATVVITPDFYKISEENPLRPSEYVPLHDDSDSATSSMPAGDSMNPLEIIAGLRRSGTTTTSTMPQVSSGIISGGITMPAHIQPSGGVASQRLAQNQYQSIMVGSFGVNNMLSSVGAPSTMSNIASASARGINSGMFGGFGASATGINSGLLGGLGTQAGFPSFPLQMNPTFLALQAQAQAGLGISSGSAVTGIGHSITSISRANLQIQSESTRRNTRGSSNNEEGKSAYYGPDNNQQDSRGSSS